MLPKSTKCASGSYHTQATCAHAACSRSGFMAPSRCRQKWQGALAMASPAALPSSASRARRRARLQRPQNQAPLGTVVVWCGVVYVGRVVLSEG